MQILKQYLSGFIAYRDHLRILLNCKFCFSESRVMLPGDADDSQIVLCVAKLWRHWVLLGIRPGFCSVYMEEWTIY